VEAVDTDSDNGDDEDDDQEEDTDRNDEESQAKRVYNRGFVRTDLANRPTEPMLVSLRARYTKLWGNRGILRSGSRQTTPVRVGVTCGSGISVVRVGRK